MIGQRNAHAGAVLIAKPRRDPLYFQNFNEKGETAGFSLERERERESSQLTISHHRFF